MKYTDILVEKKERVAYITLNKPQVKPWGTDLDSILAVWKILGRSHYCRNVIQELCLCTGMDLRERSGPTAPDAYEFNHLADRVFLGIEKFNKITIAVVNGY
jgi:enoyl-CoA hydratase/carnithine racemase